MNKKPKDKTVMPIGEVKILIEDLRSQFRVFGEELNTFKTKLDSVFNQTGKLTEEVFIIKAGIKTIKADIVKINDNLAKIEGDVRLIKIDTSERLSRLEETCSK